MQWWKVLYISDLLAGPFVLSQAHQDALRVLEDQVHLVPHLALFLRGLCIYNTDQSETVLRWKPPFP